MNKIVNLLCLGFSVILLNGCNHKLPVFKKANDLQKCGLRGKVKSEVTICFFIEEKFGDIIKGDTVTHYDHGQGYGLDGHTGDMIMFNENGYLTKERSLYELKVYSYDSTNQMTEIDCYDGQNNIIHKTTYKYNKKERKVQEDYFDGDKQNSRTVSLLDSTDRVIEEKDYSFDNDYNMTSKFFYNDSNKLIRRELYDLKGVLYRTFKYKYDQRGNLIDERGIDKNFSFYKYDDSSHLVEMITGDSTDNGNGIQQTVYKYQNELDTHGNIVKKVININGKPTYIIEYFIDYYN